VRVGACARVRVCVRVCVCVCVCVCVSSLSDMAALSCREAAHVLSLCVNIPTHVLRLLFVGSDITIKSCCCSPC
jgi:hypothetical protein